MKMRSAVPEPERFVVPLAAFLALRSYTATQNDPAGNAEAAFLSLPVAGVLAVIAALGARGQHNPAGMLGQRRPELAATALLATAAVWIAYQGPSRGAVVSLILIAGLMVSTARVLLDRQGQLRSGKELDPGVTVPLALGLQLLMRGDLLLAPLLEARTLVSLLALPLVAGGATSVLAGSVGRQRALLAAGLTAVLAPGWTMTSTFAIAALAAGAMIADPRWPKVLRWAAVAALAMLPFWSLSKGLLFVAGAMALAAPSTATASLLPLVVLAVVFLVPKTQGAIEGIRVWVTAVLLVPGALLADNKRRWLARLGVILALAAALVSKAPEAMAVGISLAAFAMPVRGAVASLQRAWCAILVIGVTLLAAYPWVREAPRGDLLALLGFKNEVAALPALLALVAGLGFALDRLRAHPGDDGAASERPSPWWWRPALLACLLLGLGLVRQVASVAGTTVLVHSYRPVTLLAGSDSQRKDLTVPSISAVVIDSHLAGGVPIASGTEAAIVTLRAADGSVLTEWPLRVGYETGEWAASRPDLAGEWGFAAPAPWLSWVAPGGGFFAQRYRARLTIPAADMAKTRQIEVRRGDDLPPETRLSIYRLELRR